MRRVAILMGTLGLLVLGLAATPAEAHDGWPGYGYGYNGYGYGGWREQAWREHEWRARHHFWRPWFYRGSYGYAPYDAPYRGGVIGFNFR